jgi:hypothetical protein
VTRQRRNEKERKDDHRIKRRLLGIGIAEEIRDTVAIASVMRYGLLSLFLSGPPLFILGFLANIKRHTLTLADIDPILGLYTS